MAYEIPVFQSSSSMLIFSLTNVDGKTVAATPLGTVPAGKNFVPVVASFVPISIVGTGTAPTVSLGTNSSTYNNLLASQVYTSTVGLFTSNTFTGAKPVVTSAVPAFVNVSIASTYTTYVFDYSVLGYFQ